MAIDYSATNQGLGGGTSAGDLQAELNQLLADGGGQSIIQPGDPNTVILDTRNGYDKTIDTVKLTEGYFTGGDGTIEANVISTGSSHRCGFSRSATPELIYPPFAHDPKGSPL